MGLEGMFLQEICKNIRSLLRLNLEAILTGKNNIGS